MTKEEAIQAAQNGLKIKHRYFAPHEWIIIMQDHIIFEDGSTIIDDKFWAARQGDEWLDGYELFDNIKPYE